MFMHVISDGVNNHMYKLSW